MFGCLDVYCELKEKAALKCSHVIYAYLFIFILK